MINVARMVMMIATEMAWQSLTTASGRKPCRNLKNNKSSISLKLQYYTSKKVSLQIRKVDQTVKPDAEIALLLAVAFRKTKHHLEHRKNRILI